MSPQPAPLSPGPSRSPLASVFPTVRATMTFPLPPDEVRRRLLGPDEREWQIGETGFFGNLRRYKVSVRPDGKALDIDGPYGNKKTRLSTEARLIPSGAGTTLDLESWISGMHVAVLLGMMLWLAIGPLLLNFPGAMTLPFAVVMAVLFCGVTVFNMRYEAGVIRDYCTRRLGDDWNRVRF